MPQCVYTLKKDPSVCTEFELTVNTRIRLLGVKRKISVKNGVFWDVTP
jgi:hypothetical protein